MHRHLASFVALAALGFVIAGCPEDNKGGTTGGASTSKPASTTPTAKPSGAASATSTGGAAAPTGNGTIKGVASLTGKAPEMKVPTARAKAEFCKDNKDVKYNAVIATGGKLKDVFVRIENGGVKGKFDAPKTHATVEQKDCMYQPRIQGVVAGQDVDIKNLDGTLHNVHTYKGQESWFNQGQPKGSDPIDKPMPDEPTIVKFACDVHPWMRGFVIVTDHPFFGVSKDDGSFQIDKIPAGKYNVEAWHSHYGLKKGTVEVADGKPAEWNITFDEKDQEPAENKDELKGLW